MGLVIGLTGGIGVGKSTVSAALGRRGAEVIDVDGVGRAVLEPEGGAYRGVVDAFGQQVVSSDGTIDRAALAAVVFGPDNRLAELEAISHPAINERLAREVDASTADVVVLDMAVLAESRLGWLGEDRLYQRVVVVEAPDAVRIPRLVERGMTEADARARMAAQASDTDRRRLADVVVTNDGDLGQLDATVQRLMPTVAAWMLQAATR